MAVQKIRIKLAAYDHELVDEAASRIVETMKKSGAKISGPIPLPNAKKYFGGEVLRNIFQGVNFINE